MKTAQRDVETLRSEEGDAGELIEGAHAFTFLLLAPGHSARDIEVKAGGGTLRVEAADIKIVRPLAGSVDPSTARWTYINGVLSVRVDKKP